MTQQDLINIMNNMASQGIIFSNEQDFQFELATQLRSKGMEVWLEAFSVAQSTNLVNAIKTNKKVILKSNQKEYTDIIVKDDGKYYAIELKYKTPGKNCVYETASKPVVVTMAQGAYDINAYEYIADIKRLEEVNKREFPSLPRINIEKGYAILLTNDKNYRYNDFQNSNIWRNYSLSYKRKTIGGVLQLPAGSNTGYQLKHRKYNPITLNNSYILSWEDYPLQGIIGVYNDYPDIGRSQHPGFSFLIIEV